MEEKYFLNENLLWHRPFHHSKPVKRTYNFSSLLRPRKRSFSKYESRLARIVLNPEQIKVDDEHETITKSYSNAKILQSNSLRLAS